MAPSRSPAGRLEGLVPHFSNICDPLGASGPSCFTFSAIFFAIPAKFAPGQKRDRGMSLLSNKFQNIDVDTGVGLYGSDVDALHRNAAANNPNLLTAVDNIRFGGSSINQSVKSFEGDQLKKSLLSRLLRLNDELFMLENGVRAAPPDKGSITKKEGIQFNKLLKNIQHERDKWAGDVFTKMIRVNSPGDTINSPITTVTSLGM